MSDCTIVIPCYNEARRLDVSAFIQYATSHDHLLLLVNDGSTDATGDILEDLAAADPEHLAVLQLPENRGKAEAVRQGILRAWQTQPRYIGYWDADLATPLETIDQFVEYLDAHRDVDILLGARVRLLGRQISRRASRHYLGRLFAHAAAATLALSVYDTQCGAELLRTGEQTRALFQEPLTRWLFDVELLARYLSWEPEAASGTLAESGIHELPLSCWRDVDGSKVKPTDFVRAAWQLTLIHRTYPCRSRRLRSSTSPSHASTSPAADTDTPPPVAASPVHGKPEDARECVEQRS